MWKVEEGNGGAAALVSAGGGHGRQTGRSPGTHGPEGAGGPTDRLALGSMAACCRQVLRCRQLLGAGLQAGAPARTRASFREGGGGQPWAPGGPGGPGSRSREPEAGPPAPLELREAALLCADMGFSAAHVAQLFGARPQVRPGQVLAVVSELLLLGLEPEPVCQVLRRNPAILQLSGKQLKSRAGHLRKLGLGGGNLQHMTHCCPDVFTMSQKSIDALVSVLKDRCLFTGQQVTEILHSCPRVLQEDPSALEYKFQYAYFRMGIKQQDLVKTKYFQYSMTKIKERHIFLERLGLYQTPDKKGQTQICNPSLKSILRVSEAEFLAKTAHSSSEEFEVFKKLLAREEPEECEGSTAEDEDTDADPEDTDISDDEHD